MFGQTFAVHDLAVIGLLIVLEGVLSVDNALVLGLLAKRLPVHLRGKALTYGLVGAIAFRIVAVLLVSHLLRISWIRLIGGLYLVYVSAKHFYEQYQKRRSRTPHDDDDEAQPLVHAPNLAGHSSTYAFWATVVVIELTDIAFAVDSIVAAVAMVSAKATDKTWIVITGGLMGVVVMRFAAMLFIKLLDRFPRFETSAYLLVVVIGMKLILDWLYNSDNEPPNLDFHSWRHWPFWGFWGLMVACFVWGFMPKAPAPIVHEGAD